MKKLIGMILVFTMLISSMVFAQPEKNMQPLNILNERTIGATITNDTKDGNIYLQFAAPSSTSITIPNGTNEIIIWTKEVNADVNNKLEITIYSGSEKVKNMVFKKTKYDEEKHTITSKKMRFNDLRIEVSGNSKNSVKMCATYNVQNIVQ